MSNSTLRFVVVCLCLCLFKVSHGLLQWEKVVNSARCRTRCLANLEIPDEIHLLYHKVRASYSLRACIDNKNCTDCMKPCSQPFVTLPICQTVCQMEPAACTASCHFLQEISTVRPGRCPPISSAFDTICVNSCDEDTDCDFGLKCCNNGCGTTCQLPTKQFENMPDVPAAPTIRERPKGNSIELRWTGVHENASTSGGSLGPVLYVIEARSNIGQDFSETGLTGWRQEAQTTETSTILRDVTPGHWYQYRVSAINLHGSKNPSPPTKAFTLSREPRQPTPPQNLSEGDTNILDGRIGVTVSWSPPKKTDLPVTRYKVFWSKRLKTVEEQMKNMREHRQVLPGDQLEYEIPGLDPDTTYFVQVQAICSYGEAKLKSERGNLYITTFPLPHAAMEQVQDEATAQPPVVLRPLPTPSALSDLDVSPSYFQHGLLKANVTWQFPSLEYGDEDEDVARIDTVLIIWVPRTCIAVDGDEDYKTMTATAQSSPFVLYDLRFSCHYMVTAQTVSAHGKKGKVTQTSFATPACHDALVLGTLKPDCPSSVPVLPASPQDFQHSFLISQNNITAKLVWRPPVPPSPSSGGAPTLPVTGYRVVWGTALAEDETEVNEEEEMRGGDLIEPQLDHSTALTKVLGRSDHMFNIGNLLEARTYVAQIQALSRAGAGIMASLHFHTPMLQITPIDPPYKHSNNKKDPPSSLAESLAGVFADHSSTTDSLPPNLQTASISLSSHVPREKDDDYDPASAASTTHSFGVMTSRFSWLRLFTISLLTVLFHCGLGGREVVRSNR